MKQDDLNTLLAKLRPVVGEMADALWLTSPVDSSQQKNAHAVAQAMAAELLGEGHIGEHMPLAPPPNDNAGAEYELGCVVYAGKPMCTFVAREGDLPQDIRVPGRSGAGKTNPARLAGLGPAGEAVDGGRSDTRHMGGFASNLRLGSQPPPGDSDTYQTTPLSSSLRGRHRFWTWALCWSTIAGLR